MIIFSFAEFCQMKTQNDHIRFYRKLIDRVIVLFIFNCLSLFPVYPCRTYILHWLNFSVNLRTPPSLCLPRPPSLPVSPSQPVCLQKRGETETSTPLLSFSVSVCLVNGSCLAYQCSSESYSGRFVELTAVAVSTSSGYDWVCRGNGMADEFRPPWGEWVIEEGWGGRSDSYPTVLGICSLKMVFFELCIFFLLFPFFVSDSTHSQPQHGLIFTHSLLK